VAHAYNPSYSGGRDQEDHSLWAASVGRGKEFTRLISIIKKIGMVAPNRYPSYTGSIRRKIMVLTRPDINSRPYSKNAYIKKAGGTAQALECLSSQYTVLSSNPSITRKKNQGQKMQLSGRVPS
jgi:hypothetical protein